MKGRNKYHVSLQVISSLLLLLGGITLGLSLGEQNDIRQSERSTEEVREVAREPEEESGEAHLPKSKPKPYEINWENLRRLSPSIVGWIYIPGTSIDYPVLQGETNEDYLRADYKGAYDIYGSIFSDYRASKDFSDYRTIIYGHYTPLSTESKNAKFRDLNSYFEQDFFDSHQTVYLFTPNGNFKGTVFGVHSDSANTRSQNVEIYSKRDLLNYATFMKDNSEVKTSFDMTKLERMLVLWTCTERETINTDGDRVPEDKSRTFVSVSISPISDDDLVNEEM